MNSRLRHPVRLLLAALVATSCVVLGVSGPAQASSDRKGVSVDGTGNGANFGLTQTETTTTPGTPSTPGATGNPSQSGSGLSAGAAPTEPATGAGAGALAGACVGSAYPGGYSEDFALPAPCVQPTCTSTNPVTGSLVAGGGNCEEPVAAAPPVITTAMVTAAARVLAPANPPHVEPGAVSYVNIPNNYWAAPPAVNDSVTLLGVTIPLQWRPTGTTWNFGDGSTDTGNGVRGADVGAPGAVEHAYQRQGSYDITTTTTYDLSFVLPGSGAQTIQVTSPPSDAVTLPIREIQTRTTYGR